MARVNNYLIQAQQAKTRFLTYDQQKLIEKLKLKYEMKKQDGQLACEGYSEHCFLNAEGKFIRLQKEQPQLYQLLKDLEIQE